MGTFISPAAFDINSDECGIIPRVLRQLFSTIEERKNIYKSTVRISFLEIYNEEINDLLSNQPSSSSSSSSFYYSQKYSNPSMPPKGVSSVQIREAPNNEVIVIGAEEIQANSEEDAIKLLNKGIVRRTVGSTGMNEQSSRCAC
jgi:hypothetical protein